VESKTEIIFSWGVGELGRLGRIGVTNLKCPKPSPHKGYTKIISKIKTSDYYISIYW
jgi:hypothetical protein